MADASLIGSTGVVIVATRGSNGSGEVLLETGGTGETFLAWSTTPLPKGEQVLVTDVRGARTVEVEAISEFGADSAGKG